MKKKISILLIMVGIVIITTGCNNHAAEYLLWDLTPNQLRREVLLEELLIEMKGTNIEIQETNATLKRIEDSLDRIKRSP